MTDGRTDGQTDGQTDGRTDGRTDGGDCNIPNAFLKKRGDNDSLLNTDYDIKQLHFIKKNHPRTGSYSSIIELSNDGYLHRFNQCISHRLTGTPLQATRQEG